MVEISAKDYPALKFVKKIEYAVKNGYLWMSDEQVTEYAILLCIKCGNDSNTKERFIYVRDMLQMRIYLPEILPPNAPVLIAPFEVSFFKN